MHVITVGPLSGGYCTPIDPPVFGAVLGGESGGPEPQRYPPVPGIVIFSGVFGGSAAQQEDSGAHKNVKQYNHNLRIHLFLIMINSTHHT